MKYRRKPVVVDAEIYRPGLEDGWLACWSDFWDNYDKTFKTKSEAEVFLSTLSPADYEELIVETPVPYIRTLEGKHMISSGGYIVTAENGSRTVMSPQEFREQFEEVPT
jgi:hypothetical protein